LALAASVVFAWELGRTTTTRGAFWLLTGTAVGTAMAKGAITSLNMEHALFAVMACGLLAWER
jgi:hypothetical protein